MSILITKPNKVQGKDSNSNLNPFGTKPVDINMTKNGSIFNVNKNKPANNSNSAETSEGTNMLSTLFSAIGMAPGKQNAVKSGSDNAKNLTHQGEAFAKTFQGEAGNVSKQIGHNNLQLHQIASKNKQEESKSHNAQAKVERLQGEIENAKSEESATEPQVNGEDDAAKYSAFSLAIGGNSGGANNQNSTDKSEKTLLSPSTPSTSGTLGTSNPFAPINSSSGAGSNKVASLSSQLQAATNTMKAAQNSIKANTTKIKSISGNSSKLANTLHLNATALQSKLSSNSTTASKGSQNAQNIQTYGSYATTTGVLGASIGKALMTTVWGAPLGGTLNTYGSITAAAGGVTTGIGAVCKSDYVSAIQNTTGAVQSIAAANTKIPQPTTATTNTAK